MWTVQIQIPSFVAVKKPFSSVKKLNSGLTSYLYNVVKHPGLQYGVKIPVPSTTKFRQLIYPVKVKISWTSSVLPILFHFKKIGGNWY